MDKNIPKPFDPYDYVREELRREKAAAKEKEKKDDDVDSDSA